MVRQNNTSIITILRRYSKVITAFLVVNFLASLVYPIASFALTSGPTNPDYTSFEPVDITDMVNLQTGDFVYNIPLLEVPGPAGGYPISLAYHAGIPVNRESSWVGLGWDLNPGAINRSVNGFPDDHKDVPNTTRTFWKGSTTDELKVGLTVGLPGTPASVSSGISVARDTYKGSGTGFYLGLGANVGFGLRLGYTYSQNPITGVSQNGSLGLSYAKSVGDTGLRIGANTGLSTNFRTVNAGFGVGVSTGNYSLLGASIGSSNGGSVSSSVGGFSGYIHNSNAGNISTRSRGFGISIPVYKGIWLDLAKSSFRQWIDETEEVAVNGALDFYRNGRTVSETAFDTYSVPNDELFQSTLNDPDKVMGGTFIDYDQYSVTGQGISGEMRPYAFQRHLYSQHKGDDVRTYYTTLSEEEVPNPEFRFVGDFSNRYEYDPGLMTEQMVGDQLRYLTYDFQNPRTGKTGNTTAGMNDEKLYGSRDIQYFDNADIVAFNTDVDAGNFPGNTSNFFHFVETNSTGFVRSNAPGGQIGAFIVTNESGVRYHYTLPAYSFDEIQFSERIDKSEGDFWNKKEQPEKYAYTWHLTAITGPDYVDRGGGADGRSPDGELGGEDWGYWVEFDYGKWTDEYHWRNPGVGFNRDLDGEFRNASSGTKELYYLDAIRTKSHTALFHKSIRADNKGRSIRVTERGGSEDPEAFLPSPRIPVPSLKLDKIELVQNTDLPDFAYQSLKDTGFEPDWTTTPYLHYNHFLTDNVLDDGDELAITYPSLRTVNLEHSYDLQPETVNSYDPDGDIYSTPQPIDRDYSDTEFTGKLTLGAIEFAGKNGLSLIPKTNFSYDTEEQGFSTTFTPPFGFSGELGALYRVESETDDRVGYYYANESDWYVHEALHLGGDEFDVGDEVYVTKTKNPPFDANAYDTWSMYKAEINTVLCAENEVLARSVTNLSAENLDVWSLRKITTPMGADIHINYQPDTYDEIALAPSDVFQIKEVRNSTEQYHLELDIPYSREAMSLLPEIRDVDISLAVAYRYSEGDFSFPENPGFSLAGDPHHKPEKFFDDEASDHFDYPKRDYVIPVYMNYATIKSYIQEEDIIKLIVELPFFEYNKISGDKLVSEFDRVYEIDYDQGTGSANLLPGSYKVNYVFSDFPSYVYGGFASRSKEYGGDSDEPLTSGLTYQGGGIAVSSIILTDILDGETTATTYTYSDGTTSYEPYGILPAFVSDNIPDWVEGEKSKVSRTGYDHYHSMIAKSRETPAPGVMYGTVKMDQLARGQDVAGHTEYEFETFVPGMLDIMTVDERLETEDEEREHGSITFQRVHTRTLALKDFTSHIGNLKTMKHFDKSGTMISETVNQYLSDELSDLSFESFAGSYANKLANKFTNQGVTEETFADARFALVEPERYYLLGTLSKLERYPSVLLGTTTIDHKTGLESNERYLEFNYYTGQPTLTYSQTGGNDQDTKYVTKIQEAYRLRNTDGTLAYEGMGLKGQASSKKNMLTQEGATVTYKMLDDYDYSDPDFEYTDKIAGIVSGNIQTWTGVTDAIADGGFWTAPVTQENIFRKRANYSYIGLNDLNKDGTHKLAIEELGDFEDSWKMDTDNEPDLEQGWRRNGTITLYNVNSQAMESVDLNGNYSSVKMDYRQERVIAQAGNADYDQFASTGFEYALLSDGLEVGTFHNYVEEDVNGDYRPHTGARSMLLYEGQNGVSMTIDDPSHQASNSGRSYQVSVWSTKADGLDIVYRKGAGAEEIASKLPVKGVDGWYLHRAIIPWELGEGALYFSMDVTAAELQIDDFRVHPVDGAMSSFVYNDWGELSYVLDQNNIYTQYRYDEMGRLRGIYRETFQHGKQLVSEFDIHYAELEEITGN